VVQVTLAMQAGIAGFAAVFLVYAALLGIAETPASSLLHGRVEDRQRSTMLSLRSLLQQLGAAMGLILAGALAEVYATPFAWIACAVILLVAAMLCLLMGRHQAAGTD
jgi:predicted MFS family arabinose efflux permease